MKTSAKRVPGYESKSARRLQSVMRKHSVGPKIVNQPSLFPAKKSIRKSGLVGTVPIGVPNAGEVLASVKRGSGAVLVRRVDFGKGLVIDVRFFYRDADTDTLMPTKSGLVFSESKDLLTLSNALLSISRGAL